MTRTFVWKSTSLLAVFIEFISRVTKRGTENWLYFFVCYLNFILKTAGDHKGTGISTQNHISGNVISRKST